MKDFLNKTWVTIVGWVGLIICAALLILGGTSVADIGEGVQLVEGLIFVRVPTHKGKGFFKE